MIFSCFYGCPDVLSNHLSFEFFPVSTYLLTVRVIVCLILVVSSGNSWSQVDASNQIRNSSFEGGIDSKFCVGRWYLDGIPSIELDSNTRVHGRYSAKVPFSYRYGRSKPLKYAGISFRSCVPMELTAGREYYFSVYLKSDMPHRAELSVTPNGPYDFSEAPAALKPISIGTDWKRFGVSFTALRSQPVYWEINVDSSEFGYVWIDALDFSAGRFISDYQPAANLEAGITTDQPGKIYSPNEPVSVTLRAYNNLDASAQDQWFRIEVRDLDRNLVYDKRLAMTIPAHGGTARLLRLPIAKNGVYRAELFLERQPQYASVLNFSVLPPPRRVAPEDGAFGIYLTLTPQALEIARRIGFSWIANLTANNHVIDWKLVERKPGTYLWYDEDLSLARGMGFRFMFNLEPYLAPDWALALSSEEQLRKWSEYVSAMIRHYHGTVKYWTISDEVEVDERAAHVPEEAADKRNFWKNAREYAAWHKAGFDAIKAVDPGAKVILNTSPDFARRVLGALPRGYVDILATNAYHIPDRVREMKALAKEYGIGEVWAPGVAVTSRSYYEAHLSQRVAQSTNPEHWRDRVRELAVDVVKTFASGATRLFHYTGTYVGNTDNFSLFEADSGLRPTGVQFGALTWLLDGFRLVREVQTDSIEKPFRAYRFDRRDGYAVFPIYHEPAVDVMHVEIRGLEKVPGLEIYDHFANRISPDYATGSVWQRAGRYPIFVVTPASHADEVEERARSFSVKLDSLPRAKSVQIAGRYAKLTEIEDRNHWRPSPNISLWYKSDTHGWLEVMRYRVSDHQPAYTATNSGFEIEWNFSRQASPFILEPGAFPADLVQGADYWASRLRGSAFEWNHGKIDVRSNSMEGRKSQPPPGADFRSSLNYVLRLKNALALTVETALEGDAPRFAGQADNFGGWSLLTRNNRECFLHWYYAAGSQGPMRIKTKLSIAETVGSDRTQP